MKLAMGVTVVYMKDLFGSKVRSGILSTRGIPKIIQDHKDIVQFIL